MTTGSQPPTDYAARLNNLAGLYYSKGDYERAKPLMEEAWEISRQTLGEQHPDCATNLANMARLYCATGRPQEAFDLISRACAIEDRLLSQIFAFSCERQRLLYIQKTRAKLDLFLSLMHEYFPGSQRHLQGGLNLVLRRKALSAEALATQRDAVFSGRYPHLEAALRQLTTVRCQIARRTLEGPPSQENSLEALSQHLQQLTELTAHREQLEEELARQIAEMRLQHRLQGADRQAVAMVLPSDSSMVEFVRFNVYDWARYAAFVLNKDKPEHLEYIDLGEANLIDVKIATVPGSDRRRVRHTLQRNSSAEVRVRSV